eukprot:Sspe_Gene.41740::Locus_20200_Transcript_1_1_Confidence_1.000_Length_2482::g.41740::m.41740
MYPPGYSSPAKYSRSPPSTKDMPYTPVSPPVIDADEFVPADQHKAHVPYPDISPVGGSRQPSPSGRRASPSPRRQPLSDVDENYVGADGHVRLLRMGRSKNLSKGRLRKQHYAAAEEDTMVAYKRDVLAAAAGVIGKRLVRKSTGGEDEAMTEPTTEPPPPPLSLQGLSNVAHVERSGPPSHPPRAGPIQVRSHHLSSRKGDRRPRRSRLKDEPDLANVILSIDMPESSEDDGLNSPVAKVVPFGAGVDIIENIGLDAAQERFRREGSVAKAELDSFVADVSPAPQETGETGDTDAQEKGEAADQAGLAQMLETPRVHCPSTGEGLPWVLEGSPPRGAL